MTVLQRMDPGTRERLLRAGATAAVLGTFAVLVLVWLGIFVADPGTLPPGPDVAWYVWRAEMLMAHTPETLVAYEGPLGAFGGAYRVADPILLALLRGLGGIDRYQASLLVTAGWSILAALAVGGVAYRLWRTPSAFVVVALAAGGMFFRTIFVGFADNMLALLMLTTALLFLSQARVHTPARAALFLLVFVSYFAHPPVAAVFSAAVLGSLVLPAVLRLRVREGIREDAPIALTVLSAAAAAFLYWSLGVWGLGQSFADAVNVPPFSLDDFLESAQRWLGFMDPVVLVPLLVVGLAACLLAWRRSGRDPLPRAIVLWLLPVLGVLGYLLGLRLPYHRFLGVTLAPVLLAGVGLWTLAVPPRRLASHRGLKAVSILGPAIAIVVLASQWYQATGTYTRQTGWLPLELRPALAAVSAYLEQGELTDRPVVYVVPAGHRQTGETIYARLWRGRWSRVRAGLPGRAIPDAYMYLGSARDFLRRQAASTGNATFDRLSEASYREMVRGLGGRNPVAFEVRVLNEPAVGPPKPPTGDAILLDRNAWLLRAPGLVAPDSGAVAAARVAAAEVRAAQEDPTVEVHWAATLRVVAALALLLLIPGLLVSRWLGVRDLPLALAAAPPLSVAMNALSGIVVLAVTRQPLTPGWAWVVVGLSVSGGGALWLWARRRGPALPVPEDQGRPEQDGQAQPRPKEPETDPRIVVGEDDRVPPRRDGDPL